MKKLLLGALICLGYIVAFDVVGVVVSLFFDVTPLRGKSIALFYTIWLVLGAFCGLLAYMSAGKAISGKGEDEWTQRDSAKPAGAAAIGSMFLLLAVLFILGWKFMWVGTEGDYYVPDNLGLSIAFCIGIFGGMLFSHKSFAGTKSLYPGPSKAAAAPERHSEE